MGLMSMEPVGTTEHRPATTQQPHAIVIGSGFGGLAAAVRLSAKGWRVTVLEKLDAPGGRAYVHKQDGFTFDAGRQVSELTAPDGSVYLMQSWSQQIDPTLSARDLPGLAAKLTLPEGWSYTTRKLKDAVVIESTSKAAIVLQDDLGNSYSLKTAG